MPIADVTDRAHRPTQHAVEVRGMFDRIAPTYDRLNRVLSIGVDTRWRRRAVRALRGAVDGPVLDLCSGTMDFVPLLQRAFPGERVVASDFSAEMLERGKHKAPDVERVVADAMKLPFADASFAKIVCGFGVRNLADPRAAITEALRVLRPGGRFVVLEFFRPSGRAASAFHRLYGDVVLPALGGWFSGDRAAYQYLSDSMKAFLRRDEYEAALRNAGFVAVEGFELFLGIASIVRGEKPVA